MAQASGIETLVEPDVYVLASDLFDQYHRMTEEKAPLARLEGMRHQIAARLRLKSLDSEEVTRITRMLESYTGGPLVAEESVVYDSLPVPAYNPPPSPTRTEESPAYRFSEMLRRDLRGHSLEEIAGELHTEWGHASPVTTRHYIEGYLLTPSLLERVLRSFDEGELGRLRTRSESLVRHIGAEWKGYAKLLDEIRPEFSAYLPRAPDT